MNGMCFCENKTYQKINSIYWILRSNKPHIHRLFAIKVLVMCIFPHPQFTKRFSQLIFLCFYWHEYQKHVCSAIYWDHSDLWFINISGFENVLNHSMLSEGIVGKFEKSVTYSNVMYVSEWVEFRCLWTIYQSIEVWHSSNQRLLILI